jgi:hypothetical protein
VWLRHGGSVRGLPGACCWRCGGSLGRIEPLPVEVLRRWRGTVGCLGHVRAIGMVRIRAKAFTYAFVCGHDGGVLGRHLPTGVSW